MSVLYIEGSGPEILAAVAEWPPAMKPLNPSAGSNHWNPGMTELGVRDRLGTYNPIQWRCTIVTTKQYERARVREPLKPPLVIHWFTIGTWSCGSIIPASSNDYSLAQWADHLSSGPQSRVRILTLGVFRREADSPLSARIQLVVRQSHIHSFISAAHPGSIRPLNHWDIPIDWCSRHDALVSRIRSGFDSQDDWLWIIQLVAQWSCHLLRDLRSRVRIPSDSIITAQ